MPLLACYLATILATYVHVYVASKHKVINSLKTKSSNRGMVTRTHTKAHQLLKLTHSSYSVH